MTRLVRLEAKCGHCKREAVFRVDDDELAQKELTRFLRRHDHRDVDPYEVAIRVDYYVMPPLDKILVDFTLTIPEERSNES